MILLSASTRYVFPEQQTDKPLKAHSVGDLILRLIVRQIEQSLQDKHLEHHHNIERRSARIIFAFLASCAYKQWSEGLKINDVQFFKGISQLCQFL